MRKSKRYLLLLTSLCLVAVAGCRSQSSETAASNQAGTTPQAAAVTQAAEAQRVAAFQQKVDAAKNAQIK